MAIYTFRPDTSEGSSMLMRFVNLPSDRLAKAHARTVLDTYRRAASVQIWDGERLVDSVLRGA